MDVFFISFKMVFLLSWYVIFLSVLFLPSVLRFYQKILKKNHVLKCWDCVSSKLEWGFYSASIAKIAWDEILLQKSNAWVKEGNSDLSADKLDEVFNHVKIENKEVGLDTSTGHFYSGYLIVGIFYWQVYYVLVKYI